MNKEEFDILKHYSNLVEDVLVDALDRAIGQYRKYKDHRDEVDAIEWELVSNHGYTYEEIENIERIFNLQWEMVEK